jgi:DNA-binding SARP family transcriptional activator
MQFRILGPLEALDGDRRLDLGAPGQRAMLTVLLLHANEIVPTERLADDLWPAGVPRTAAKTIQVYVSNLRKAFGAARDALETHGSGYLLRVRPGELDLYEFERLLERAPREEPAERATTLRSALSLWRGEPLADFAYDQFVQTESARLEELRRLALEERIEADLALGRGPELVPELETLVAQRPLDEHPRAQLMLALYRAGRQADALAVFRDGRRVLDEELGLELGEQLRELERAILRQDPALSVTAAAKPSSSIIAVSERPSGLALLLPLAEALAHGPTARELVLAQIVQPAEIAAATRTLEQARHDLQRRGAAVRVAAFSSSSPAEDIVRLTTLQDADLLMVASAGDPLMGTFAGVFAEATCDVAALIEWPWDAQGGPIVVAFGAFEHDWAALELGAWAATALDRPLHLIGAADDRSGERDASRLLADASLIVQHTTGVVAEPLLGRPGKEGIVELAQDAGLLVLGLSERWRTEGLGATRSALVAAPPAPTVLVRRGLRPSGIAPPAALTRFTWSLEQSRIGI